MQSKYRLNNYGMLLKVAAFVLIGTSLALPSLIVFGVTKNSIGLAAVWMIACVLLSFVTNNEPFDWLPSAFKEKI